MDCRLRIADCGLTNRAMGHGARTAVWGFCVLLLTGCGRPQTQVPAPVPQTTNSGEATASNPQATIMSSRTPVRDRHPQSDLVAAGFGPAKVSILPLSEMAGSSGAGPAATLDVYVALLDAFSCPIKGPGVLRFELYEYISRPADPKGQRIVIWPDYDLTSPAENNKYWRDFLRAYEFELDVRADPGRTYILEATCLCPDGRRLTGDYMLKGPSPAARPPARTTSK